MSVVVVTGDHPEPLHACLVSLKGLRTAPLEIILVDTSSDDRTMAPVTDQFKEVRVLRRSAPARKAPDALRAGYEAAAGDVIAFVGFDVLVDPLWLDELLLAYAHPGTVAVGGRLVEGATEEASDGVGEIGRLLPNGRLTFHFAADPGREIEVDHLHVDNVSFLRSAVTAIGGIHRADPSGSRMSATQTALRLGRAGGKLVFQPSAVGRRSVPAASPKRQGRMRSLYETRRDQMCLLMRVFGLRNALPRRYILTAIGDQRRYVWLTRSHFRTYTLTGHKRTPLERARAALTPWGAVAELAGVIAGAGAGMSMRRSGWEPRHTPPEHRAGVTCRTVQLDALTDRDIARWAELAESAIEPNPFFHPAYLHSAFRLSVAGNDIRLIVVETAEAWLAVMPIVTIGRFGSTPVRYASTAGGFLGERASLCVPLLSSRHAEAAARALLTHLSQVRSGVPALVEITLVPEDSPAVSALFNAARSTGSRLQIRSRFERAYLRDNGVTAPEHFSSGRRKQLQRKVRGLEQACGGPVELIDHGGDATAFEKLLDLEAAGWKGRRGSAKRMKPAEEAWYRAAMTAFRARGLTRTTELRAGDRTVHMSLLVEIGSVGFGLLDSFDEEFSPYSPGTIGRTLEQRFLIDEIGLTAFDPCMHPKSVDATALYSDRRAFVSILIASRGTGRVVMWIRRIRLAMRRVERT